MSWFYTCFCGAEQGREGERTAVGLRALSGGIALGLWVCSTWPHGSAGAWPHSWCSGLQDLILWLQGGRHSGWLPFYSCPGRQVQPLLSVMEIWASGTEIPALRSHRQHSNIGDIWITFCIFWGEWWGQSCNFMHKPVHWGGCSHGAPESRTQLTSQHVAAGEMWGCVCSAGVVGPPQQSRPPQTDRWQQEQLCVFAWGAGAVPVIQKHLTHFTSK